MKAMGVPLIVAASLRRCRARWQEVASGDRLAFDKLVRARIAADHVITRSVEAGPERDALYDLVTAIDPGAAIEAGRKFRSVRAAAMAQRIEAAR